MFKLYLVTGLIFFSASMLFAEDLKGKALAKKYCSECHQEDGNSKDENIPKIAGFTAALTYAIFSINLEAIIVMQRR